MLLGPTVQLVEYLPVPMLHWVRSLAPHVISIVPVPVIPILKRWRWEYQKRGQKDRKNQTTREFVVHWKYQKSHP